MSRKPRRFRWLRIGALVVLCLAGIALFLVWTGRPQEFAAEYVGSRALGVRVEVEWARPGWTTGIRSLRVFSADDAAAPILEVDDVAVEFGRSGQSRLQSVRVGSISAHLHVNEDGTHNFAWLEDLLSGGSDEPSAWSPKRVVIERASAEVETESERLRIAGLRGYADLDDTGRYSGWVGTIEPAGALDVTYRDVNRKHALERVGVTWADEGGAFRAAYQVELGESSAEGEVVAEVGGDAMTARVVSGHGSLSSADVPAEWLPPEIGFARVAWSDLAGSWTPDGGAWPSVSASIEGGGLRFSLEERRFFDGDAQLAFAVDGDAQRADAAVTFADGQSVAVTLAEQGGEYSFTGEFTDWSREQWMAIVPAEFRGSFETLDVQGVSAAAYGSWGEGFLVSGSLRSAGAGGESPFGVSVELQGASMAIDAATGWVEAVLAEGKIRAELSGEEGAARALLSFEQVDAAPWVRWLSRREMPETLLATANGMIEVSETADGSFAIHPALTIGPLAYQTAYFEKVTVAGEGRADAEWNKVTFPELIAEADDFTTKLVLSDFVAERTVQQVRMRAALDFDLAVTGTLVDQPDLYGTAQLGWEGSITPERAEGTISFTTRDIGYGDLALPYGRVASMTANLFYDLEQSAAELRDAYATLGGEDRVDMPRLDVALDPLSYQGEIQLHAKADLLAEMGWIKSGDATLLARAAFQYSEAGEFRSDWSTELDAPEIMLASEIGSLRDLTAEAIGTYSDGELDGTGAVHAVGGTAAGALLTELRSDIVFDGDKLIMPELTGGVFNGTLRARLEAAPLREGLPIWVDGALSDIDLAVLTEQVQPPKTTLTGIGHATLSAALKGRDPESFHLEANSNQGFSLNRSLVEELLPMDRLLGGLGQRQAQRTVDKFLGTAPQRPFDTATMMLDLIGGAVTGEADLLSEKTNDYNGLNLHINLDIDAGALGEALRLLEEGGQFEM